jgi:hypothetical protein
VVVEIVENAVSREGFRGDFAANTTKAKPSKKLITPRQMFSNSSFLCAEARRRGEDMKRRR